MVKRSMVIGMLCFGLTGLLQTQAMAWNIASGGWGWGSYELSYDIRGGQKPGTTTTFVGTTIQVYEGALVCLNPGTNRLDVRQGKGGITFFVLDEWTGDEQYDERGRFNYQQSFCATVGDDLDGDPTTEECGQIQFESFWGVDSSDCRNYNWLPHQFLVKSLNLNGQILTDCAVPAEGDPVDTTTCDSSDDISLYCETDEDLTTVWPGMDGEVRYVCVDEGAPVAWDDNYSVRAGKTLNVRAPGVLDNDSDAEGDPLTSTLVGDVSNGTLELRADGSFTYTPGDGFTGDDSFTYKATDDSGNEGNEATVTITVY